MRNNSKYPSISAADLSQWLREKKNCIIIDILPQDHFNKVHLPSSRNACVFEVSFVEQVRQITIQKDAVIVLCGFNAKTMDSLTAAEKLLRAGYTNISILSGGLEGWREKRLPLEGSSPETIEKGNSTLKLFDGKYTINSDGSSIIWTGRNPNSSHFGNVSIIGGSLKVADTIITGNFGIDMESITNINLEGDELQPVLIEHLKSDDFFDTGLFPMASFEITDSRISPEPYVTTPNVDISGKLSLRGIQSEQSFPATIVSTEEGLRLESHFDLDRTRWNIIYGSARFFEHLGMHTVFDLISIQLRLTALRKSE